MPSSRFRRSRHPGPQIRQNLLIQSERQQQAALAYESSVLSALQEVEDALTALAEEQSRRDHLAAAAAEHAADLSLQFYAAGLRDFRDVLDTNAPCRRCGSARVECGKRIVESCAAVPGARRRLGSRVDDSRGGVKRYGRSRQRFAGAAFRLVYTASMNMSVVHGPVFAPNCVS